MLWYGKYTKLNFAKIYKRRKLNYKSAVSKVSFIKPKYLSLGFPHYTLPIPSSWNLILFKSKVRSLPVLSGFLYSDRYYFRYMIPADLLQVYVDFNTNLLVLKPLCATPFLPFLLSEVARVFKSFNLYTFAKLKIKGKGYYIYKTFRNTITHQFGHSHRRYIYSYFVFVKFLSKTTVLLFGSSKTDIFHISRTIRLSKPLNIFTGRGVRFTRQIVYKKTGKVSSYR